MMDTAKFCRLFFLFAALFCLYSQAMAFEVENLAGYLVVKQPLVGVAVVPYLERVENRDKWGQPFPLTLYRGKYYLQTEKGRQFGLDFKVSGEAHFLFVTTIDGINIIGGGDGSQGYVVSLAKFPGDNTVSGWRTDKATVYRFIFADEEQSLAATMGHLEDAKQQEIGMISVRVFAEYAAVQPVAGNSRGLGTGVGERVEAPVESVRFSRGELVAKFVIHYISTEQLSQEGFPVE